MGHYIEQHLGNDEQILFKTDLNKINMWVLIGMWAVVFLILIFISKLWAIIVLALMGFIFLRYNSVEFAVTSKRIIKKSGIVIHNLKDISLKQVETMNVIQGPIGRKLNYGTVTITGTGGAKQQFGNIKFPIKFHETAMEAKG